MRTGYYPGCSLHGTAREFDESLRAVASAIGVSLAEIEDWNCCGASSAHAVSRRLAISLPARNLALAEAQGVEQVLAPCAACYNRLATARRTIEADAGLRQQLPAILGRPFGNTVAVRNILEFLTDALPVITPKITRDLSGLRLACYYGCLLVRPAAITSAEDPEAPTAMEQIAAACGATTVRWHMALECCGGSLSISRTGSVIRLGRAILDDARKAGAEAVLVACPMCHSNLDFRQRAMTREGQAPLPVLYLTELVGLAMGLEPASLGLARHFVSVAPLLARAAAAPAAAGRN
jgi:heterodisulfide reductase subunit B